MGIFSNLACIIANLICVGVDVSILLLVCQIIADRRSISWLERINEATKVFVEPFNRAVGQLWYRVTQTHLSWRSELFVGLLLLLVARATLCEVVRLL